MLENVKSIMRKFIGEEIKIDLSTVENSNFLWDENLVLGTKTDSFQLSDMRPVVIGYKLPFVPYIPIDKTIINSQVGNTNKEDNTTEDTPETSTNETLTLADVESKVSYAIDAVLDDIDKIIKLSGKDGKMHTEFGLDKNGNIVFQEKETQDVYNEIVKRVKNEIKDFLVKGNLDIMSIIGESNLEKLIQAAWISTYNDYNSSKTNSTGAFVTTVLENLKNMINAVAQKPELMEILTQRASYADSSVTNGIAHYNTNTTYGGDEVINYRGNVVQYDDGTVHLDNTNDDKDYQKTMNDLLKNLLAKYSGIDPDYLTKLFQEAQKAALAAMHNNTADCPYGTGNNSGRVEDGAKNWSGKDSRKGDDGKIHMDELVQMTLYYFDKLLYEAVVKDGEKILKTIDETAEISTSTGTTATTGTEQQDKTQYSEPANNAIYAVNEVIDDIDKIVKLSGKDRKMHTEFGLDKNGNIVFQEKETQDVYNEIVRRVKNEINGFLVKGNKDILSQLGGAEVIEALIQAAWIATYNDFDSSKQNNTEQFVNKVLSNLNKMLDNIAKDASMLDFYTKRCSYADSSLTCGLKHYNTNTTYGGDEVIIYSGKVVQYEDGTVHIDNTIDDNDYQQTMEPLLQRLIQKYPNLSKEEVTKIFREAQKAALEALQNNTADCPYGTGNNSGRVEDGAKNWSGKDSRKGDDGKIHMDELVQMTLYYFDKLLLNSTL